MKIFDAILILFDITLPSILKNLVYNCILINLLFTQTYLKQFVNVETREEDKIIGKLY